MPQPSLTVSPSSEEWEPRWTVITTPPNLAERWAARRAKSFLLGGPTVSLVSVVCMALYAFDSWSRGQQGNAIFFAVAAGFFAFNAWDRYAFGLLFGRYDAELRDIQTRRPIP